MKLKRARKKNPTDQSDLTLINRGPLVTDTKNRNIQGNIIDKMIVIKRLIVLHNVNTKVNNYVHTLHTIRRCKCKIIEKLSCEQNRNKLIKLVFLYY